MERIQPLQALVIPFDSAMSMTTVEYLRELAALHARAALELQELACETLHVNPPHELDELIGRAETILDETANAIAALPGTVEPADCNDRARTGADVLRELIDSGQIPSGTSAETLHARLTRAGAAIVVLNAAVTGTATYLCPHDGSEWDASAVKMPENMDPAALNDSDRCPACGRECDQIIDWCPA